MSDPSALRPLDDELLLAQQCGAGNRVAQHALFVQQRARVHRTLFRILGSNRHMEDLLQDTFIEVLGSIDSFGGRSSLATWIDSIAARVAFRHLSRREPRPAGHAAQRTASQRCRDVARKRRGMTSAAATAYLPARQLKKLRPTR